MAKSRDKGLAGQREVVYLLRKHLGLGDKDVYSGGCGSSQRTTQDVEVVPDVVAPGLWVEVKRYRAIAPNVWRSGLEYAAKSARSGCMPVCFYRGDREPWRVACYLADLALAVCKEQKTVVHLDGCDFAEIWQTIRAKR